MAVQSKFLVPGKKYLANKWYCTLYSNIEKDITASLNSHLFYSPPPLLKISKCNSKRCFTCPDVSSSQCDNDPNLATFCKAYNVIYKISYNLCNMSYVGETSTPLHLINIDQILINMTPLKIIQCCLSFWIKYWSIK